MAIPVIIDYDLGFDWDDMVAHLLLPSSPELDVRLIVTDNEYGTARARFARQLLGLQGLDIPVAAGTDLGNRDIVVENLLDNDPAPVDKAWERAVLSAVGEGEEVVYLGLGAMTNIARLLNRFPFVSDRLRLVQMGGALSDIYRLGRHAAEYNVRLDPQALLTVLCSDIRSSFVMSHTTNRPEIAVDPPSPLVERMRASERADLRIAAKYFDRWCAARGHGSFLHDPLTCCTLLRENLVSFTIAELVVDSRGCMYLSEPGKERLRAEVGAELPVGDPLRTYLEQEIEPAPDGDHFDVRISYAADYDGVLGLVWDRVFS
jgi:pyrimidine-specific ribonucleoside hydrolase